MEGDRKIDTTREIDPFKEDGFNSGTVKKNTGDNVFGCIGGIQEQNNDYFKRRGVLLSELIKDLTPNENQWWYEKDENKQSFANRCPKLTQFMEDFYKKLVQLVTDHYEEVLNILDEDLGPDEMEYLLVDFLVNHYMESNEGKQFLLDYDIIETLQKRDEELSRDIEDWASNEDQWWYKKDENKQSFANRYPKLTQFMEDFYKELVQLVTDHYEEVLKDSARDGNIGPDRTKIIEFVVNHYMESNEGKQFLLDDNNINSISAFEHNFNTVSRFLKKIEQNERTGNVEYHISFCERVLNGLEEKGEFFQNYVQDGKKRLEDLKKKCEKIIGKKKRIDGLYIEPSIFSKLYTRLKKKTRRS